MKKFCLRLFFLAVVTLLMAIPLSAQLAKKMEAASSRRAEVSSRVKDPGASRSVSGRFLPARTPEIRKGLIRQSGVRRMHGPTKTQGMTGPNLNGSVIYNNTFTEGNTPVGLYEIGPTTSMIFPGPNFNGGGVFANDTIYGTRIAKLYGMTIYSLEAYKVSTGEKIRFTNPYGDYGTSENNAAAGMSVNPVDGKIYGIGMTKDNTGLQLARFDCSGDGMTVSAIAPIEGNWAACSFDSQGKLYGISYKTETDSEGNTTVMASFLNIIDINSGETTLVGELQGMHPRYGSSAVIDTKTDKMYWNYCPADETSWIYEIDLQTAECTPLYQISTGDNIMAMYVARPPHEAKAPGAVDNVNFDFPVGSLSGKVNLDTPSAYYDGSVGEGSLQIHVSANGVELATHEATFGESVSVDIQLQTPGEYNFSIYASNDEGKGPEYRQVFFVGKDAPAATTATLSYNDGYFELNWLPVTSSANGGYLDPDAVTYDVVRYPGQFTVAEDLPASTTYFKERMREPEQITSYYYEVIAKADGFESAPARSNSYTLGSIDPPYQSNFYDDGLAGWTVLNENNDEHTWEASVTATDGSAFIRFNSSMPMDDWLVTPPIKMVAKEAYRLSFKAKNGWDAAPETLEVKFGKQPNVADMCNVLIEPTVLTSGDWVEMSCMVIPETDGTQFIGFHGMTQQGSYYLYVKDIKIEAGVTSYTPGLPTDVNIIPDPEGRLEARITFNAPSRTMNGDEELSSLKNVKIMRDGLIIKSFSNPTPGSAIEYTDVVETGGVHTYSIVGSNDLGDGLPYEKTVFIGNNVPAAPENIVLNRTETDGMVLATWTPVKLDKDGQQLPSGSVKYNIYNARNISEPTLLAEGIETETYSYQAVPAGEQEPVRLAVQAVTTGGAGEMSVSRLVFFGTPSNGLHETGDGEHQWLYGSGTTSAWGIKDASFGVEPQTGTYYFVFQGALGEETGELASEMISLDGIENPGLTFYTYNIMDERQTPNINEITVLVKRTNENDYCELFKKSVHEICGDKQDWGRISISLQDYAGDVIEFMVVVVANEYTFTFLDNFSVGSILSHDLLAAGIKAPENALCGSDYEVEVEVDNIGAQASGEFKVELYANEELTETKIVDGLGVGAIETVRFKRSMSPIEESSVTYYAVVSYSDDQNPDNNRTSSVTVSPVPSELPTPQNLEASVTGDGVNLTWNAPNTSSGYIEPVTEDFESGDGFSNEFGDWTFADMDGCTVGGFDGMSIPNITIGATTGSFWIWDTEMAGNSSFAAHSGTKYLFALFCSDASGGNTPANSDWAISPELCGDAQTISFYAKSYDASLAENVAVYYSKGSLNPSDFVKVEGAGSEAVPGDWTKYEANLPKGAKRFAIVCESYDKFMLMVDDVTFRPEAPRDLDLMGYNIFRDGDKINSDLVLSTEYMDTACEDGETYVYVVTAVFKDKGESGASNEVTVEFTGISGIQYETVTAFTENGSIVVLNAVGQNVNIFRADGVHVHNSAGSSRTVVPVEPGVYLAKIGNRTFKLHVK